MAPCVREAVERLLPFVASPEGCSPEDLVTAIATIVRLTDMNMEVLRDTCLGAYMRDLCDHSSAKVRSAACIALDCFQTMLFDWAESIHWSKDMIAKACMEADREMRHRACANARITPISSGTGYGKDPAYTTLLTSKKATSLQLPANKPTLRVRFPV
ncbi:hypothetical protein GOP47_0014859 [Adiantum capillus-veneris]|uniref:Uncharacterized protein n=1 Tax=Adiantum capillus-veneris TaxID=13818 RepID=A0A9D4UN17_ADICA|nr:hypothetical protein GOP47_0014859 [Adiantum capillus-veneris]